MNIIKDEDDKEYYESASKGLRPFSEFMWFAIDKIGQIASFTPAGFAVIPMAVFRSKSSYFECFNYFQNLPHRCEFLAHDEDYKALRDSWLELSSKGLFSYDWACISDGYEIDRPYSLLASPVKSIQIPECSHEIQKYLSPIRFKEIKFNETHQLMPQVEFPDNNWSAFMKT